MTNFHDVLIPSQAKEMSRFLRALYSGARDCQRVGVKPDIHAAMQSWGQCSLTTEEKAIAAGFRERERKAKIQREGQAKCKKLTKRRL